MARNRALETRINDPSLPGEARLEALRGLAADLPPPPARAGESNNHVHTIYSFSPYSPAMAALRCFDAGLEVAGSVDHDSIAAAPEMRAACGILGIGAVTGCELRVSFKGGPHADRKINNPDSPGIAYMTIQALPAGSAPLIEAFLEPIRARRRWRTAAMSQAASALLEAEGLQGIDFTRDVVAHSKAEEGGGITERHLLAAVARKLVEHFGAGAGLVDGLRRTLRIDPPGHLAALIADPRNQSLLYDLLGLLKSGFLERIYIQPDEAECPPAAEAVSLALSAGAIPAYAYLGDVGESPTGDKKAEKFEDDFLNELFDELVDIGFPAVTYMPPRNTASQLERVRALCGRRGLMEISGVDINQPRQSFSCPELRRPEFRHLADATWALVANEALASVDPKAALFSAESPLAKLAPSERVAAYAAAGRDLDQRQRGSAAKILEALMKGKYTR